MDPKDSLRKSSRSQDRHHQHDRDRDGDRIRDYDPRNSDRDAHKHLGHSRSGSRGRARYQSHHDDRHDHRSSKDYHRTDRSRSRSRGRWQNRSRSRSHNRDSARDHHREENRHRHGSRERDTFRDGGREQNITHTSPSSVHHRHHDDSGGRQPAERPRKRRRYHRTQELQHNRNREDNPVIRTRTRAPPPRTRIIGADPQLTDSTSTSNSRDHCIEVRETTGLDLQYFPNFYSSTEATRILSEMERNIEYDSVEQSSVVIFGKKIAIPRKQTAFGDDGLKYTFSGNTVRAKEWCTMPLLKDIKTEIEEFLNSKACAIEHEHEHEQQQQQAQTFNFCLVNRYKDGKDSIGFHRDDERDIVGPSSIIGVSFGAERELVFKHKSVVRRNYNNNNSNDADDNEVKVVKLLLKSGSLVVMQHPTNQHWYHGIQKRARIKDVRVSLTYRQMHTR